MQFAVLIGVASCVSCAQETATFGTEIVKLYQGEGHYEYNSDGVPLIGIIATRMDKNRVKFTTCGNLTLELNFEQLKRSKSKCPAGKKHQGIWTVDTNKIAPVYKVGDSPTHMKVQFEGKIQQIELPDVYKQSVSGARSGGLIGYTFKDYDGKKSLMIFKLGEPVAKDFVHPK